ncbi:MAG: hypothetical protein KKI08_13535, partial [Armatimonadetes bacterium]|nr:hypothetical protein [Armatimonadota bacterium]
MARKVDAHRLAQMRQRTAAADDSAPADADGTACPPDGDSLDIYAVDHGGGIIAFPFPESLHLEEETKEALRQYLRRTDRPAGISEIHCGLLCVLLGRRWSWDQYDEWHGRFKALGFFPKEWAGLEQAKAAP